MIVSLLAAALATAQDASEPVTLQVALELTDLPVWSVDAECDCLRLAWTTGGRTRRFELSRGLIARVEHLQPESKRSTDTQVAVSTTRGERLILQRDSAPMCDAARALASQLERPLVQLHPSGNTPKKPACP